MLFLLRGLRLRTNLYRLPFSEKTNSTMVGSEGSACLERMVSMLSLPPPVDLLNRAQDMASSRLVLPAPVSPLMRNSPPSASSSKDISCLSRKGPKFCMASDSGFIWHPPFRSRRLPGR